MDDLKRYRAPRALDYLSEDLVLIILLILFFGAWLADRMGWLA